jgi:hypothetical protein
MRELDSSTVEMLEDNSGESSEGFGKSDCESRGKVRTSPTENGMLSFDEMEDDVTRLLARYLIGFPF